MVEREENLVDFVLLSYCLSASKRFAAMMEKESAVEGVQGAMSIEEPSRRHNNNNNRRGKPQKEKRNNNLERKTKRIKNTRELCLLSKSEESLRRCIVLRRRNPLDINDNRWHARTKKKRKTPTTPTMKLATVQSKKERRKERTKRIV
jgi:hypothetical protein